MPETAHQGRHPAPPKPARPIHALALAALLAALLLLSAPARSASAPSAGELAKREKLLVDQLENADRELAEARKRARDLAAQAEEIEKDLTKTNQELIIQKGRMEDLERDAASRLTAYYKLCRLGAAPVFLSADSFFEAVATHRALSRVIEGDVALLDRLQQARTRQEELASRLLSERHSATSLQKELAGEIKRNEGLRREKAQALAAVRKDKRAVAEARERLSRQGKNLAGTVEALARKPAGAKGFAAEQGRLPLPVEYGRKAPRQDRSGLFFDVQAGEPIRAVGGGKVVFSGWFAAYGNLIIVDHGNGYFTIYAHAEDLFKQKGDRVEQGEVIATSGDTGSALTPGLYFEIRHHVKALPAGKWLAAVKP